MGIERQEILKPLIESSKGVHLTSYLINSGDIQSLKAQLRKAIAKAEIEIKPVMDSVERRLFLAPLRLLLHNDSLLKSFKHNIGIFRRSRMFRVIALPVDVESDCVVATTFHVKPLLRWLRVDRDFLLMGIGTSSAHLYLGSQKSLRQTSSFELSDETGVGDLEDWIARHTQSWTSRLFLVGAPEVIKALRSRRAFSRSVEILGFRPFRKGDVDELCADIRSRMELETLENLEDVMNELHHAEKRRATQRNIFQIAKAVAEGRVKKLVVADGVKVFGSFDSQTGEVRVHAHDLDHEDDDILDDIAQCVLSKGGEVVVTAKDEMPDGQLAWALLSSGPLDCDLTLSIDSDTVAFPPQAQI